MNFTGNELDGGNKLVNISSVSVGSTTITGDVIVGDLETDTYTSVNEEFDSLNDKTRNITATALATTLDKNILTTGASNIELNSTDSISLVSANRITINGGDYLNVTSDDKLLLEVEGDIEIITPNISITAPDIILEGVVKPLGASTTLGTSANPWLSSHIKDLDITEKITVDDGGYVLDDSITTAYAGTFNSLSGQQGIGIRFSIAQPITITHFKCMTSQWLSSATLKKMRIYTEAEVLVCDANIDKLTPVNGWYETAVGPFVLPAGTYRSTCFIDGSAGDLIDYNNRTYSSYLTILSGVEGSSTGTNPNYPTTTAPGSNGGIGQFRFYVGTYTHIDCDRIINVSDPVAPQDVATKNYVDTVSSVLPSMRMTGYNSDAVKRYLTDISNPNKYSETLVIAYTNGATVSGGSPYSGSVYSPSQNRIYFVPRNQGNQSIWHYINCDTGAVVPYTHGATATSDAYSSGVYSPSENRIYFAPRVEASSADWHYVNCDTGVIQAYTHGFGTTIKSYSGGVYSPVQNRIYFIPYLQAPETTWHYVDCDTGAIQAYTNGVSVVNVGYGGNGSYSPSQNRIYLTPFRQSAQNDWHYIDCNTTTAGVATVVAYTHGATVGSDAYFGSVYSPKQDRIYFVPHGQSTESIWHYIDCNTGGVVAYTHGFAGLPINSYYGGVYSPTQNRIYFTPYDIGSQTTWHYIDCDDGSVVAYTHGATVASGSAYNGASYSPTENRIYFAPRGQGSETDWHYLKPLTSAVASISFSASTLMGN